MFQLARRNRSSVFVSLSFAQRCSILGLLALLLVLPFPFVLGAIQEERFILYCAYLLYVVTLGAPFIVPRFRPGLFHPLVFYVLWNGVQGLLSGQFMLPISGLPYHRALGAVGGSGLDLLVAKSFFLEAIALLLVYCAYVFAPAFRVRRFASPDAWNPAMISMVWVGLSCLGLLALATIGGGLDQVLMQRGMPSDQRIAAEVGGHWGYLAGIGVVAPLVWIAFDRRASRQPIFWAIVLTAMLVKFGSTGSRGGTIIPLIMIGSIYVLHTHRVPFMPIVVGFLVTVLLIGGLGQYRSATMRSAALHDVQVDFQPLGWASRTLDELHLQVGANNGQLAVLGSVPERVPHLWGRSYLSVPYIFLPSAIFGEKPPAAGRVNSTVIYGNPLNTIPIGQLGEAYWNFSYPGILAVSILFGVILKLFAQIYRNNPDHPLVMVVFLYLLFYFELNSDRMYSFVHLTAPAVLIYLSMVLPGVFSRSVLGRERRSLVSFRNR
jgi:hypothetical protein